MTSIDKIVNLEKHPINALGTYVLDCYKKLNKQYILKLDSFLTLEALNNIKNEAENLKNQAYYCSQLHTILLNKKNKLLDDDDPCNIEVKSDKGCVPHDKIPKNSFLNQLYNSNDFKKFVKNVLNLKNIYPYKDKLSSINYNYYEKSQQLGWHFDNASFAITLMISTPNKGGKFQYITKVRDYENNYINKKLIKNVFNEKTKINELTVDPGTLILFYGRNYLHRVTPVESQKGRILVTLNYNLEKGIELSPNARKTFFGRLK
jgi:hypothetical protein